MAPKRKPTARNPDDSEEPVADGTTPSPPLEATAPTASVAELYATLQSAVSEDPAKIDEHARALLQLLSEAENPDTPLLLRVRALEFVARYGHHLRDGNALKKVVTSLVRILSGAEDTPPLLIAAVHGIAALGPVSVLDKRWEYLSREGADVLMQVMLDEAGFSSAVRHAASSALDALVQTSFRPVVTKLLHWMSDDREAEDDAQLAKERRMALAHLRRLALDPAFRPQWTAEVEAHVLGLIQRVFATVTAAEFAQLVPVAAALPSVRAEGGRPLLAAFLARHGLRGGRGMEQLALLAPHVDGGVDLLPALADAGALSGESAWAARAVAAAARLAPPESADAVYAAAFGALRRRVGGGEALPDDLTALEALLFAVVAAGQRVGAAFLRQLRDEAFGAACGRLAAAVAELEARAVYAVKKLAQQNAATACEAQALGCLHNLRVILGAFAAKHIPMGALTESWTGTHQLPTLRRETAGRAAGKRESLATLPPPPGTGEHTRKRTRAQSSNGGHNNKHNHNSNNGRNKRNRGDHSRGRRGGFY